MATKTSEITNAIKVLADAVKGLEIKIDKLQEQSIQYPLKPAQTDITPMPVVEEKKEEPAKTPFPQEWRMIIDNELNSKFEGEVEYRGDGTFQLIITVPKEYSNAPLPHFALNGADKRVKILNPSLGAAGVRDYAKLVAENLGADIMRRVIEDKAK